jgi:hypothetical protein
MTHQITDPSRFSHHSSKFLTKYYVHFISFLYCIHVDPIMGCETSSQTLDTECVKYNKSRKIRTNAPSIVGTSKKKSLHICIQHRHNIVVLYCIYSVFKTSMIRIQNLSTFNIHIKTNTYNLKY